MIGPAEKTCFGSTNTPIVPTSPAQPQTACSCRIRQRPKKLPTHLDLHREGSWGDAEASCDIVFLCSYLSLRSAIPRRSPVISDNSE